MKSRIIVKTGLIEAIVLLVNYYGVNANKLIDYIGETFTPKEPVDVQTERLVFRVMNNNDNIIDILK